MPPPRTINAKQLTLLMLTMIVVPILCGIGLYWFSPKVAEPILPAQVKLASAWLEDETAQVLSNMPASSGKKDESSVGRRLVPCIVVRNTSRVEFGKLSLGLNDQFFSTGNKNLEPGDEVSVPLESFIARNGSVRFPVGNRSIRKITVFAQLGTGARGISEYLFDEEAEGTITDWKDPSPKTPSL